MSYYMPMVIIKANYTARWPMSVQHEATCTFKVALGKKENSPKLCNLLIN